MDVGVKKQPEIYPANMTANRATISRVRVRFIPVSDITSGFTVYPF
jgi:hypothetical protein